jgi:hypothetical protein
VKQLDAAVRAFAIKLCREYAGEIDADPCGFKQRAKRLIGCYLPPYPGRPRKESVTRACELKRQRVLWPEIYAKCIPEYKSLTWPVRRLEIARLLNAVRARHRLETRQTRKTLTQPSDTRSG